MPQTAIVIGATGLIGQHLVKALLQDDAYNEVRAVGRKPLSIQHHRLKNIVVAMDDEAALREALQGDVLFCCIGTTIKKAGSQPAFRAVDYDIPVRTGTIAKQNNVPKYLLVSAIGANAHSSNFYLRTKGEVEQALMGLQFSSLYIFRPSLLMGNRQEVRFGEQVGQFLAPLLKWFLPVKYRPVKGETVAQIMILNAKEGKKGVTVIEGFE